MFKWAFNRALKDKMDVLETRIYLLSGQVAYLEKLLKDQEETQLNRHRQIYGHMSDPTYG